VIRIVLFLLLSFVALSGCGGEQHGEAAEETGSNGKHSQEESNAIVTKLEVSKQNDAIVFHLRVENHHNERVKLVFSSGKTYEMIVKNEQGTTVYDSSQGKMYTQAFQEKTIEAGEEISWEDTWRKPKLSPGTYEVQAKVVPIETEPASVKAMQLQVTKTFKVE
jgi:hypothetical protein